MNETLQQSASEFAIRKIVAEVCGRSTGGTKVSLRLGDLHLRGKDEDEISWRISRELHVEVPRMEWAEFRTVGDLVLFVQMCLPRNETF